MTPERIYLHIGLHKTGTTYLQSKFRRNAAELRAQGIYFTTNAEASQYRAVDDLQGRRPRNAPDDRSVGAWPKLVAAINGSRQPVALVSDERLSLSGLRAITNVTTAFAASELHVVVTVRDLARVLVSSWQETIKGGATWTWEDYVVAVRDPAQRGANPARGFWATQDLPQICAAWEAAVPAQRFHIVTVPPGGTSGDVMLHRFCSVIGADADLLIRRPRVANPSNDIASTEMIRRLNERLGGRLNERQYDWAVKMTISGRLPRKAASGGVLPASEYDWVAERVEADQKVIAERGYHVSGDLDDLVPARRPGPAPGSADDAELLDAALAGLTVITQAYARDSWERRPSHDADPDASGKLTSRARGVAFRTRNRLLRASDEHPSMRRVTGWAVQARAWRHRRAMRAARRRRDG